MEEQLKREMGYINDLAYGYIDTQGVGLKLNVRLLEGFVSLFMDAASVTKLLTESKLSNIGVLQGKPIVVTIDENKTVRFEKFLI
jgi:hypothetical protein